MFDISEVGSWEELSNELTKSAIPHDTDKIKAAYDYAARVHAGDVRKSGDSQLEHLLTVASYLARAGLDDTSIIAGLLHEVLSKEPDKLDEIDKLFGTEVAFIITGLTDMEEHTKVFDDHNEDPQNFRHLIINGTDDIRVLIVRLANKLHNVLSLGILDPERQRNQAYKILMVYAPLCEYIGLGSFQSILENEAFKFAYPDTAKFISDYVTKQVSINAPEIDKLINRLRNLLGEYNVTPVSISSRAKNIYSIYNKVKRKYLGEDPEITEEHLAKVKDLLGVRLILSSIEECYLTLGLLHGNWDYFPEEFDDYIVRPKQSGYKSIHTVINHQGQPIEIQIRTQEMHEYNEFGPASHIAYKLKSYQGKVGNQDFGWTKNLTNWKTKTNLTKEDFAVKAFANSIFVFTPKGKVIQLPKDASPLDFAFRIHTNLGARYLGAKVNNQMRPMSYKLKTGEIVEILEGNKINVNQDWLKYAVATSTKSHIRKYLKPA